MDVTTIQQFLAAIEKFPFYKEAVYTLGFERIIELDGNHKKIKNELQVRSRQKLIQDKHPEIIQELIVSLGFSPNKFVSSFVSKKTIKEVYRKLCIPNDGVVSSEIRRFFKTTTKTDNVIKKIRKKPVRGYILIEPIQ